MKKQSILIVGSGDVACRAIPWLSRRFRVLALVRNPADRERLRNLGATPLAGDLDMRHSLHRLAGVAKRILYAAPPPSVGHDDPRMRNLIAAATARGSVPQALVYISTSGVYGDCRGALVNESQRLAASTPRARRRVAAEARVRRLARRRGTAVSILRAPGIYGAGRTSLARLRRRDPVLTAGDDVFTSHIHADDLARAACLALFRAGGGRVFNLNDDTRMTMGDYFDLMADVFELPRPPRLSRAEAEKVLSPAALSFMSESRRLDNRRMKRELRLALRYPTVREGLLHARACDGAID